VNLLAEAPVFARLLLVALLVGAAIEDVRRRRIANSWCAGVLAVAGVAAIAAGPTIEMWQNGVLFALLLALGLPLFAAGWLGGGDVKLLATLGAWTTFAGAVPLLVAIFITGGVVAALSLAVKGGKAARRSKGLPYGVPIAIGAMIVMLQPVLSGARAPTLAPLDLKAANERAGIGG